MKRRASSFANRVPGAIAVFLALLGVGVACELFAQNGPLQRSAFQRGDANGDRELDVSDPLTVLLSLFSGAPVLACEDAADSNDDGAIDVADAIHGLSFLFGTGPPPPDPYPGCGGDPTDDVLTCASPAPCGAGLPPLIVDLTPRSDSLVSDPRPTIRATIIDQGGRGIDARSIVFTLDDRIVEPQVRSIDSLSVRIEFTPAEALADGSHKVTILAWNHAGNSSGTAVSLFAVCGNRPPTLDPIDDVSVTLGSSVTFRLTASDPEADAIVFDVEPRPLPPNASLDAQSGQFDFRPEPRDVGSLALTFSARDRRCGESRETVVITVRPSPRGRTSLSGRVVRRGDAPLAGVRLVVVDQQTIRQTLSDARGKFFLDTLPAGQQRLLVDGSTVASVPGTFPTFPLAVDLLEGAANVLDAPIVLLPLDSASADRVVPETESVVTSSPIEVDGRLLPSVTLTVGPETAWIEDSGELFSGSVHITRIPAAHRPPWPRSEDFDLSVLIALEPVGVRYDPPAEIAFPNVERFPPGAIVDIFGLNRDTGVLEKVGEGVVHADGMVRSIGGVVTGNSWFGFAPGPLIGEPSAGGPPSPGDRDDEPVGSTVSPRTGDLTVGHNLVPYRSLGLLRSLRLEYHSSSAYPRPVVAASVTTEDLAPPPEFLATEVTLAGVEQGREVTAAPGFCPADCPLVYLPRAVDATALTTGEYPASITVDLQFPLSRRSLTFPVETVVINNRQSAFGAGWNLKGLQRLHRTATGALLLTSGDDSAAVFTPATRASAEIRRSGERDAYHFAASRDDVVSVEMIRHTNRADGSGSLNPALELRSSRGIVLARDDDGGSDVPGGVGRNATIRSFVLPATDTYTIVASGRGGSRGPYQLLFNTSAGAGLAGGPVGRPGFVTPAFVFLGEITTGVGRGVHTFAASVGTRVTIAVNRLMNRPDGRGTLDPTIELRSSRGIVLGRDNDGGTGRPPGPGRNALIPNLTLPATDAYEIRVAGAGSTAGPYEVTVTFDALDGHVEAEDETVSMERVLVSPPGDSSQLTINEDGSFVRRLKNGTVITFDADGFETAVTDRNGNTTRYTYGQRRLVRIEDPVGFVTRLRYANGLLSEIEGPSGRVTRLEHDGLGNLTVIEDPDGTRRLFTYDVRSLMATQTNQRGFVTRYDYDFSGRFVRSRLPDESERLLTASESVGLIDPASGLGTEERPAPFVLTEEIVGTLTDGEGRTRSFATEALPHFTRVESPAGLVTEIQRDDSGRALRVSHPSGIAYAYTYDDRGNLRSLTNEGLGGTQRFGFEPLFNGLISVTDATGETGRIDYDDRGHPIRFTTAAGRTSTFEYDDRGQVTRVAGAVGAEMNFTYDEAGNVTGVVQRDNADERAVTLGYTPAGYLRLFQDASGGITRFAYDAMGRVVSQTRPDGNTVRFDYDAVGNLISLEPPGRPPHRFVYSPVDLTEEYVPPTVDGESAPSSYAYNLASELTRASRPDGRAVGYAYDEAGRRRALSLPRGELEYGYDPQTGHLTTVTAPDGSSVSHDYEGGLLTRVTWSGRVAGTVGCSYDVNGRIRSSEVNGEPVVEFERDADALLIRAGTLGVERDPEAGSVSETRLGSIGDTRTYNAFGELVEYTAEFGGSEIYREELTRDARGRVAEQTVTIGGRRDRSLYRYDTVGQLTVVETNGATEEEYTYDANGNRLTFVSPDRTVEAVYDERDRLEKYGSAVYEYTESGDLVSRVDGGQVTTYDYDVIGNLLGVVRPDGVRIEYLVDGRHRRIGKIVDGTFIRGLLYKDRLHPIAELDGDNRVVSWFVYATRNHVPDYMVREGATYRVIADHLGSPRLIVNVLTGEIAQRLDYSAFGRVTGDTNPGFQPFGFAGGIYDPDTGLVRFGARDYDAESGRWTRPNPVYFAAGQANLYLYVGNHPVNSLDPSGVWNGLDDLEGRATTEDVFDLQKVPTMIGVFVPEAVLSRLAQKDAAAFRDLYGSRNDGSRPQHPDDPADAGDRLRGSSGGGGDPVERGVPPGGGGDRDTGGGRDEDDLPGGVGSPCDGDDVCPVLIDGRLECIPCTEVGS